MVRTNCCMTNTASEEGGSKQALAGQASVLKHGPHSLCEKYSSGLSLAQSCTRGLAGEGPDNVRGNIRLLTSYIPSGEIQEKVLTSGHDREQLHEGLPSFT